MSQILIDNKLHNIDVSDGKGELPFSMNGVGGKRVIIDGNQVSDNGFIDGGRMCLDGKVNFKHERKTQNFDWYDYWIIDDKNYQKLKKIHKLDWEEIKKTPRKKRLEIILWGLKYQPIEEVCRGYRFGRELTYNDFCVCFDKDKIIVFKSSHNGYIAPDYLNLDSKDKDFDKLFKAIKKTIINYFNL